MQKIVNRWPFSLRESRDNGQRGKNTEKKCHAMPCHGFPCTLFITLLEKKVMRFFRFFDILLIIRSRLSIQDDNKRHIDSINGIDFFFGVLIVLMTPEFFGLWHVCLSLSVYLCVYICLIWDIACKLKLYSYCIYVCVYKMQYISLVRESILNIENENQIRQSDRQKFLMMVIKCINVSI